MKATAILIFAAAAAIASAAPTQPAAPSATSTPDGGLVLTLGPEHVAKCQREGGCHTVTKAALRKLAHEAFEDGLAAGASRCLADPAPSKEKPNV
jgi:hypothetical protein